MLLLLLYTGPPVILSPEQKITGGHGDKLMINCPHEGAPSPHIKWLQDDVAIKYSDKYSVMRNGSLLILSLNAEDVGMWTCVVYNVFGQAQLDVNVTYHGDEGKLQEYVHLSCVMY